MPKPELTIPQILTWVDAFHARYRRYPRQTDGRVRGFDADLTWSAVSQALKKGSRGLPGGTTLAELLRVMRGVRNPKNLPRLTAGQILAWVDEHRRRTGNWPTHESGEIPQSGGETWQRVETALREGIRGLRGGSSLAEFLKTRRRVRNRMKLPPLTVARILEWADRHHARTGRWPLRTSGRVRGESGEKWQAVDAALFQGSRGLPGGCSLARLLADHRGVRHPHDLPGLTVEQILAWADAHKERTGKWPTETGGLIVDAPNETWDAVNASLDAGRRGLPGGDTLARFLARHRGKRNLANLPPLTADQIMVWIEEHYRRCGQWPNKKAGAIPDSAGETWCAVNNALERRTRGLAGGWTLFQLCARVRERMGGRGALR